MLKCISNGELTVVISSTDNFIYTLTCVGLDRMVRTYDAEGRGETHCVYLRQRLSCALVCDDGVWRDGDEDDGEDEDYARGGSGDVIVGGDWGNGAANGTNSEFGDDAATATTEDAVADYVDSSEDEGGGDIEGNEGGGGDENADDNDLDDEDDETSGSDVDADDDDKDEDDGSSGSDDDEVIIVV